MSVVPRVGGKKNDNKMRWPLLTFGSKTEPVKLVFTIENEKLVSADEVRVTIGREGRLYGGAA